MDILVWVKATRSLAERIHQGQRDKAGADYFKGHLSYVASLGRDWREQVVGFLHDASEDTPHTLEEILELLAQEAGAELPSSERLALATALRLLDHHNAPDRAQYIQGIGSNALATAVKLHDLQHNMDLSRLGRPLPSDFERLARYRQEYAYLSERLQALEA